MQGFDLEKLDRILQEQLGGRLRRRSITPSFRLLAIGLPLDAALAGQLQPWVARLDTSWRVRDASIQDVRGGSAVVRLTIAGSPPTWERHRLSDKMKPPVTFKVLPNTPARAGSAGPSGPLKPRDAVPLARRPLSPEQRKSWATLAKGPRTDLPPSLASGASAPVKGSADSPLGSSSSSPAAAGTPAAPLVIETPFPQQRQRRVSDLASTVKPQPVSSSRSRGASSEPSRTIPQLFAANRVKPVSPTPPPPPPLTVQPETSASSSDLGLLLTELRALRQQLQTFQQEQHSTNATLAQQLQRTVAEVADLRSAQRQSAVRPRTPCTEDTESLDSDGAGSSPAPKAPRSTAGAGTVRTGANRRSNQGRVSPPPNDQ